MTELDIVLEVGKRFGVDEALVIYSSKVEVKDWVYTKAMLLCEHFPKSFPDNSILPAQMRALLREYTKAIIVIGDNGVMDIKKFRQAMLDMEEKLILNGYPKAMALYMGPSDMCERCNPFEDKPNRVIKRRPSIEGTGIDILGLTKKFKKNIEFLGKRYYSVGLILLD